MATVAEILRTAREERKLSVYQVAEATKIKTDHVRALDEGNYNAFAAPVYIRGFVRTYATLLKMDVPKIITALDAELAQTEKFKQLPNLSPTEQGWLDYLMLQLSRLNWRIFVPMIALATVAGLVYLGMRTFRSQQAKNPLATLGSGLYKAPTNNVRITLPLPTNLPPASPAPKR
jgi:cytoskeletal protein RodZ